MDGVTDSVYWSWSKPREKAKDGAAWCLRSMGSRRVGHDLATEQQQRVTAVGMLLGKGTHFDLTQGDTRSGVGGVNRTIFPAPTGTGSSELCSGSSPRGRRSLGRGPREKHRRM